MKAHLPQNEARRLDALLGYEVLDTPPEPEFDDLTELAALICATPTALITLVDRERQWFKSCRGLGVRETHRDLSFCAHAILGTEPLIVHDAREDPRFADNALVTGEPYIRFYAGVPLVTSGGFALGTLAVIDYQPRDLTPEQVRGLEQLARQAVAQLELRRLMAAQCSQLAREAAAAVESIDQRLRTAIRAANVGLWDWDLRSNRVFYSAEWKRQIGYAEHEIADSFDEWRRRVHPDDLPALERDLRAFVRTPRSEYRSEFRFRHRDGSYRWILAEASMQFDAQGEPVHMLGSHIDITERRRQEDALSEAAEFNRQIVNGAREGIAVLDRELRYQVFNPFLEELSGWRAADVLGQPIESLLPPENRAAVLRQLRRALAGESTEEEDMFFPARDELPARWINTRASPLRDSAGHITGVIALLADITARKTAELAVQHLNRVYAVLSAINQTIVRQRDTGVILEAACRIAAEEGGFELAWAGLADAAAGVIRMAATAGPVASRLERDDIRLSAPGAHRLALAAVRTGSRQVANVLNEPDNPVAASAAGRSLRAAAAFPLKSGGRVVGVYQLYSSEAGFFDEAELRLLDELAVDIGFALEMGERDIEWRRAEAGLRRSEERFRQLAESVQEVFWLADPGDGEVHYVSPAYERVWGEPGAALYAEPGRWRASIHPDDRHRIAAALDRHKYGHFDEEFRILRPDGAVRWIRTRTFPVHDRTGAVYRIAGVAEDVTERKSLESQLFRAQRMESVGRLATGMAHDMNNILAPIIMAASLIRGGLPPEELEKMLGSIEASARRGAGLARQLLLFGRGVEAGLVAVKTPAWIGEVVSILRETLPRTISIDCRIAPDVWSVRGDPTQLHQVLLNLCVNACDAMPEGGTLTLAADNIVFDDAARATQPEAEPGDYVRVSVSDTGTGIAPQLLDRIFDPFFTTKDVGKGTGLGLSIALGIVKSHGGFMTVRTEVQRGTTFEVFLPALLGADQSEEHPPAPLTRTGGGETILVVDDEPDVREVLSRTLVHAGYRVLQASDGAEALRLFTLHGPEVALVLTDLDMPGMDGIVLLTQLRRLRPDLPAVISSGVLGGRVAEQRMLDLQKLGVAALLHKPYSGQTVINAVREALR